MSCPFLLWVWLRGELEAMFLQSSLPIHDFTYDAVIHNRDLTPDFLMAKSSFRTVSHFSSWNEGSMARF